MTEATDQQILNLYSSGKEQDALRLLMKVYQERVYWQIRRVLITHEDTDDVLQNVIIKVWKNLSKFSGKSKLHTWIYRIAHNESLNFLEKNKHHLKNVEIPDQYEYSGTTSIDDPSSEEIQQRLEMALNTLPEKQRLVFHMKYFDSLKYIEISEITGTSVGSLKANYHLAVKKIEDFIKSN